MRRLKQLALAVALFLAPIAAAMGEHADVYTDTSSNQLHLHKTPCAVEETAAIFGVFGAPPSVIAAAKRATVHAAGKTHEGCWIPSFDGERAHSAMPTLGLGVFTVDMEHFEPHRDI